MEEYKIPEEIEEIIPQFFYIALGGEIISVYGLDVWNVVDGQCVSDYIGGSAVLACAIKMTCWKLDMMWLYEYYNELPWYDSDQFDSIMIDRARNVSMGSYKPGCMNTYYLHLVEGKVW